MWQIFGRYRWRNLDDSRSESRSTHELTGGVRGTVYRELLFQSEIGGRFEEADDAFIFKNRFTYAPRWTSFSLSSEADLELHNPDDPLSTKRLTRLSGSLFWDLPYRIRFFLQVSQTDTETKETSRRNFQVILKASKSFDWGRHRPTFGGPPAFEHGIIHGKVFYDANMNGAQDRDEPGIPGIRVSVDGRYDVKTDKYGKYIIHKVASGLQRIDLVAKSVPAEYIILTPLPIKTPIERGQKIYQEFTFVIGASVHGKVINADTSEGMPNIALLLKPGNAFAITDDEGAFEIENLLPGKYTVVPDPRSLPDRGKILKPASFDIGVIAGGDALDITFSVRIIQRPVFKELD